MRRVRVFLGLVGVLAAALVTVSIPDVLDDMELFRVVDYRLEGATFLTLEEAVTAASVPRDASIWDDRSGMGRTDSRLTPSLPRPVLDVAHRALWC